jgi:hypothetical protein
LRKSACSLARFAGERNRSSMYPRMGRVDGRAHRRIRSRSEAMAGARQDIRRMGIAAFSAYPARGSTRSLHEASQGVPTRMAVIANTGEPRLADSS